MKKFKYLYFSNIISSSPLYKLWLFKKIKGGEEDDGNLLSHPTDHTSNGIEWKWTGMTATGTGKASSSSTIMNETTPLKDNVVPSETYTFSIKTPLTKILRLFLITEGGTKANFSINPGTTSRTIPSTGTYSSYYLQYHCTKGDEVNVTIEDIKLTKGEE